MQSLILTGGEKEREKFWQEYAKTQKISDYNIFTYIKVKIADVREIKKKVSIKQGKSEKRLFVLSSDITLDAQNALLKTLEELPDGTQVFISIRNKDSVIPTILSRCKIVDVGFGEDILLNSTFESEIVKLVDDLIKCKMEKKDEAIKISLLLGEKIAVLKEGDMEELIVYLRSVMLGRLLLEKFDVLEDVSFLQFLIKNLNGLMPLMSKNNLNKRITINNVLLASVNRKYIS